MYILPFTVIDYAILPTVYLWISFVSQNKQ